ncbi:hypothetical protein CCUS01_13857, partial [Colletotrichum cuscutae]
IRVRKFSIVIIKRKRAYYFALLINKEFATIIEAIFIIKNYILVFLIFSSFIYIAR